MYVNENLLVFVCVAMSRTQVQQPACHHAMLNLSVLCSAHTVGNPSSINQSPQSYLFQRQYWKSQMRKRRIPLAKVQSPKPMNDDVRSSLTAETHDLVGMPSSTFWIQLKRAFWQIPAHSYSSSKNSIQSLISVKSPCSLKFLANSKNYLVPV